MGESWREADFGYETDDVISMVDDLFEEVLPLYKQLHAYVRRKLHRQYGDVIDLEGPIQAHLLGKVCLKVHHRSWSQNLLKRRDRRIYIHLLPCF